MAREGPSLPASAEPKFTTTEEERNEAFQMKSHTGSKVASWTDEDLFRPVEIEIGVQKYVLIAVNPGTDHTTYLVRGHCSAAYHKDAARQTTTELSEVGISYNVLGGGRIDHNAAAKTILVFGFSYGFPWRVSSSF